MHKYPELLYKVKVLKVFQTVAPPPPSKIAPRLGLGFGWRLGLVLGLGDNQAIAPWLGLGFG